MAVGLAVALLSVTADPADARTSRRWSERRAPAAKLPPSPAIKGPLIIAVSIGSQRLTVYDDGVAIAQTPVSTGMRGHATPTGVFSIIQKSRFHRSNIYSGAPMPFMQRITWSGIALHAGALPGYPASHGCIRLPHEFAARLWGMTKLGARVIVSRHDITPFDITHARLSALEQSPEAIAADRHADALRPGLDTMPALSVAVAPEPVGRGGPATKPHDAAAAAARVKTADATADTVATDAAPSPAAAEAAEVTSAIDLALPVAAKPDEASPEAPASATTVVSLEPPAASIAALALDDVFLPPARPVRPLRAGPITVFVSRKDAKLYVRKRFDPLFSLPVTIARADQPIGTHVFTAAEAKRDGAGLRWIAMTMPGEPPALERRRSDRRSARADKRAAEAVRVADAGIIAAPATAAEALDRVDLPADLVARIAALMSAGASLIISDQGLGHETGLETDFIVLTR